MSNKKINGSINQITRVKDRKKIKNLMKLMILFKEKSEKNTLKIQYTNILLQSLSKPPMESIILVQGED